MEKKTDFSLKGKIIYIGDVQEIGDTFKKLEFAIEFMDGDYAQIRKFELHKDNISKITNNKIGDVIDVHFNLKGRAWTKEGTNDTRYFNTDVAWSIYNVKEEMQKEEAIENPFTGQKVTNKDDGLPF